MEIGKGKEAVKTTSPPRYAYKGQGEIGKVFKAGRLYSATGTGPGFYLFVSGVFGEDGVIAVEIEHEGVFRQYDSLTFSISTARYINLPEDVAVRIVSSRCTDIQVYAY